MGIAATCASLQKRYAHCLYSVFEDVRKMIIEMVAIVSQRAAKAVFIPARICGKPQSDFSWQGRKAKNLHHSAL